MDENVWRGLAGEPQVSEQGSRKKGMWNFPDRGREMGGLVLERMTRREV